MYVTNFQPQPPTYISKGGKDRTANTYLLWAKTRNHHCESRTNRKEHIHVHGQPLFFYEQHGKGVVFGTAYTHQGIAMEVIELLSTALQDLGGTPVENRINTDLIPVGMIRNALHLRLHTNNTLTVRGPAAHSLQYVIQQSPDAEHHTNPATYIVPRQYFAAHVMPLIYRWQLYSV